MSERKTIFSPCRSYRYVLWREWDFPAVNPTQVALQELKRSEDYVMFIGLNPSTADEVRNDPTIRRCIGFAKAWGFSALCMTNLFAYRATLPTDMKRQPSPIGEENNLWLTQMAAGASKIIAAWGNHGAHLNRDKHVRNLLPRLECFRITGSGQPAHPLYMPASTPLIPL